MRLEGKIAVVTGAAGGIGRATAQELALRGAKVIALDVDTKDGELTASIIRKEGGECTFIFMDVTDPSNVANVASTILREFGAVDILVNNAGIWRPGTILTLDVDSWASVFNTNVRSVFLVSQQFLPSMISREAGVIVNLASVAGMVGAADASAYAASKGAVINLTRAMALDFAPHKIRVNCVCPGMIDSRMGDQVVGYYRPGEEIGTMQAGWQPLAKVGNPEDIAKGIAYMASDDAAFMTGSIVVIDGGLTAQ